MSGLRPRGAGQQGLEQRWGWRLRAGRGAVFLALASQVAWSALHLLHRDVRALGITLMGHQKKILGSIQTMRAQLTSTQGPRRHL